MTQPLRILMVVSSCWYWVWKLYLQDTCNSALLYSNHGIMHMKVDLWWSYIVTKVSYTSVFQQNSLFLTTVLWIVFYKPLTAWLTCKTRKHLNTKWIIITTPKTCKEVEYTPCLNTVIQGNISTITEGATALFLVQWYLTIWWRSLCCNYVAKVLVRVTYFNEVTICFGYAAVGYNRGLSY